MNNFKFFNFKFKPLTINRIRIYEAKFARFLSKLRIFLVIGLLFLLSFQLASGFLLNNYSRASSGRDYDDNAVIYGGALSLDELAAYINSGSDGRHGDIQTIFHTLGIYPNEFNGQIDGANRQTLDGYVHKDGSVTLASGQTVARGVISAGRTYLDGSTADVFGLPIYWRPPAISMVPDSLSAFVHLVNGKFSWAVIKSCGNPVKVYGTPQISLQKYVRNVTKGTNWSTSVNADLGDTLEYKITYQVGDESLNDVYLYDTLKGEVQNHTASNREYLTDPTNLTPSWFQYHPDGINIHGYQDQRMLVWYAPGRAPRAYGEATFTTTVRTDTPREVTKIYNDAACYAGRIGVVFSNIVEVNINQPTPPPPVPDLSINKTASLDRVNFYDTIDTEPGKEVYFRVRINNISQANLVNTTIRDTLPERTSYVSGSTYLYNNQFPSGQRIEDGITSSGVNVGNYALGESCYVIFKVRLNNSFPVGTTRLENIAYAWADGVSAKHDNAFVRVSYHVVIILQAKSAVNLTQGGINVSLTTSRPGDVIRYSLITTNYGDIEKESYVVGDNLEDVLEYADVTDTGGGTLEGHDIVYPAQSIPAGEQIIKYFTVTIKPYNRWPSGGDLLMRNVYGNEVVAPVGEIVKWKVAYNETKGVDATTVAANPGDVIRYTLYTKNDSSRKEENFVVYDDISDILEYADIKEKNSGVIVNKTIRWDPVDIEPGQTIARVFKVTVKSDSLWPTGGDRLMTNIYGNKIDIPVTPVPQVIPAVKGESIGTVKGLSATGTILNVIFGTLILLSTVYLYFRQKFMLKLALLSL